MDQMGKNRTEPGRAFGPSGLIHRSGLELFDLNFWGVKMNAEHALSDTVNMSRTCQNSNNTLWSVGKAGHPKDR